VTFTGASGENDEDIVICLKGNALSGFKLEYAGYRNECKYCQKDGPIGAP